MAVFLVPVIVFIDEDDQVLATALISEISEDVVNRMVKITKFQFPTAVQAIIGRTPLNVLETN